MNARSLTSFLSNTPSLPMLMWELCWCLSPYRCLWETISGGHEGAEQERQGQGSPSNSWQPLAPLHARDPPFPGRYHGRETQPLSGYNFLGGWVSLPWYLQKINEMLWRSVPGDTARKDPTPGGLCLSGALGALQIRICQLSLTSSSKSLWVYKSQELPLQCSTFAHTLTQVFAENPGWCKCVLLNTYHYGWNNSGMLCRLVGYRNTSAGSAPAAASHFPVLGWRKHRRAGKRRKKPICPFGLTWLLPATGTGESQLGKKSKTYICILYIYTNIYMSVFCLGRCSMIVISRCDTNISRTSWISHQNSRWFSQL